MVDFGHLPIFGDPFPDLPKLNVKKEGSKNGPFCDLDDLRI